MTDDTGPNINKGATVRRLVDIRVAAGQIEPVDLFEEKHLHDTYTKTTGATADRLWVALHFLDLHHL